MKRGHLQGYMLVLRTRDSPFLAPASPPGFRHRAGVCRRGFGFSVL